MPKPKKWKCPDCMDDMHMGENLVSRDEYDF